MDKYQERIMQKIAFSIAYNGSEIDKECFDKKEITVKQLNDITITKYNIYIYPKTGCNKTCIERAYAVTSEKKETLKSEEFKYGHSVKERYVGLLDFDNRIYAIELRFKNDLAEPLTIPVKYIEADKEKYYAQKEQERKEGLLKAASIKVSTGIDLVNIYFQPCCEEYARTEIVLYKDNMMLAKYKVDEETFFKSINGLAYGKYEFILKQFDDKGNIVLETENITFTINPPPAPEEYVPYTII